MTAQAAFDIAIPDAGMAAAFTNGERALTVADPSTGTAAGTYFLSKFLNLKGGIYTVKANSSDPFSVWAGKGLSTSRRVLAVTPAPGTASYEADVFLQPGTQRFDLTVGNLTTGQCFVVFSLWKDGRIIYSSEKTGWVWDTVQLADEALTAVADPRLSLPVWSISPNWRQPVLERLWWLTDVLESETSVEQRRSMLRHPKRSWEASFLRADLARMRMNNFISSVGLGKFLCPFWPEQMRLQANLASGATEIQFARYALDDREFFAGSLALLTDGRDVANYELVQIQSVTSAVSGDTITLVAATAKTWGRGARITPVYEVRFDGTPTLGDETDRAATVQARFEAVQTFKHIVPSWGNCSPLWSFKLDWRDKLQSQFERQVNVIDNPTGIDDYTDYGGVTRVGVRGGLRLFGRESVTAYRSFLAEARGRNYRFWWPSGTHDVEPTGAIGGLTLGVVNTGFFDWYEQPQDARRMLMIEYVGDAPPIYRRIEGVEKISSTEDRLTFNRALPTISRAAIKRISYLMPVRFDQDQFELSYVTDNCAAVRAAVVVRSADIDGMPDLECSVTSQPYPVVVNDSLNVSAAVLGGWWGGVPEQVESLNVSAVLASGELVTALRSVTVDSESLNVAAAMVSGQLDSVYESLTAENESLNVAAALVSGSLQLSLVSATIDFDSMNVSANITAGTLT